MNINLNKKFLLKYFIKAILIFGLVPNVAGADNKIEWSEIYPGVEYGRTFYSVSETKQIVEIEIIRAKLEKIKIQVHDSFSLVRSSNLKYPAYSLRELDVLLKPIAIINGGFTQSLSFPLPAGLVLEKGQTKAPLNIKSKKQSGVLCIKDKSISIINKKSYQPKNCIFGLQSGPRIVEYPGINGIKSRKNSYIRSAIGIDKKGRVLFLRATEIALYDLAKFLIKDETQGGLNVKVALNMSGDIESGMIYKVNSKHISHGDIDATIASAVSIMAR